MSILPIIAASTAVIASRRSGNRLATGPAVDEGAWPILACVAGGVACLILAIAAMAAEQAGIVWLAVVLAGAAMTLMTVGMVASIVALLVLIAECV